MLERVQQALAGALDASEPGPQYGRPFLYNEEIFPVMLQKH